MKKGSESPKSAPQINDFSRIIKSISSLYDDKEGATQLLQQKIGALFVLKKYRAIREILMEKLENFSAEQIQMARRRQSYRERSPISILKAHLEELITHLGETVKKHEENIKVEANAQKAAAIAEEIGITREAFEEKFKSAMTDTGSSETDDTMDDLTAEALNDPVVIRHFKEKEEEFLSEMNGETLRVKARYASIKQTGEYTAPDRTADRDIHNEAEAFAMAEQAKLAQRAKTG